MRYSFLLILICFFQLTQFGQVTIKGKIQSTDGSALAKINVLVYQKASVSLIAYAVTDTAGKFSIQLSSKSDSLDIEASAIHYRNISKRIPNKSHQVNFTLEDEVMELETVTIKAAPIEKYGDTILYNVVSFSGNEDRSIEDVLRKMPGIEVEPDGQILYQGLPLQKFYVEGLDLMNGRYVVISKNLPHSSVSSVEVIENHQPIKMLEDKVASTQASLNLKLKRNVALTGTAELGVGAAPFLWEANITPMMFTKNYQLLASYQTNNTGNDVAQQIGIKTLEDIVIGANRPIPNPSLLEIQLVSQPPIEPERYLDNEIHFLNFNNLVKLNQDLELRANLFYVYDFKKSEAGIKHAIFYPTDTIRFAEVFNNNTIDNYLYGEFTLNKNTKNNFLNNKLSLKASWDEKYGLLKTQEQKIVQNLEVPVRSISNELRSINQVRNRFIEILSYISFDRNPQSLTIEPGQFEGILNMGKPYQRVDQEIALNRFFTDNSVSLAFSRKRLLVKTKLGAYFRQQQMESTLYVSDSGIMSLPGADFINNLEIAEFSIYLSPLLEYALKKLTIKAKLPLNWLYFEQIDDYNFVENKNAYLFFNPLFSIDYKISGYWRIRGTFKRTNKTGNPDNIYYGFILNNYRLLSSNTAMLPISSQNNFSVFASYKNPIWSFFNSINYIYAINHTNTLFTSIIQSDGKTGLEAVNYPNKSITHYFQGQTSKYFSKIKTTIGFKISYNYRDGLSFINGDLFDSKNVFIYIQPSVILKITNWLNSEYELNASSIKSYVYDKQISHISLTRHFLKFYAFPTKAQLIGISSEYYNNNGNNYIFVDFQFRYTFRKSKIDIEFKWHNIFNTRVYTSYMASGYEIWESNYLLRPSQAIASIKFSF